MMTYTTVKKKSHHINQNALFDSMVCYQVVDTLKSSCPLLRYLVDTDTIFAIRTSPYKAAAHLFPVQTSHIYFVLSRFRGKCHICKCKHRCTIHMSDSISRNVFDIRLSHNGDWCMLHLSLVTWILHPTQTKGVICKI